LAGALIASISGLLFGPLTNIFRTAFIGIREEKGENLAIKSTSDLIGVVFLISITIIISFEFFPNQIAQFIAPGYGQNEMTSVINMIRLLLPSLLINQVIVIWTSVLNSYNSFLLPDIFAFFSSILNIVLIITLSPIIDINSLVVSNYISSIILSIILIRELKRKKIFALGISIELKSIKPYIIFSSPLYFSFFAAQFLSVIERRLCTFLGPGTVSSFDYSKRFIDLTLNVILSVVPMVLTPILAALYVKNNHKEFAKELLQNIRMFMIGILPLVVLFTICSKDLVLLLLVHGKFEPSFVSVVSSSMTWLGIGMIGVVLYVVSGEALVAQKKIKLLTLLTSLAYISIGVIDLVFYKEYGASLFAFSWAIIHLILGLLVYFSLLRSEFIDIKTVFTELFRISTFYLIVFSTAYLTHLAFDENTYFMFIIFKICTITFISVLLIISVIFLLRMDERHMILRIFNISKREKYEL
jgi:peptidoglycan biosynthesis protein MviN/MurJ (putative lipid II flippase)